MFILDVSVVARQAIIPPKRPYMFLCPQLLTHFFYFSFFPGFFQVTCVIGDPVVPPAWVKSSEGERIPDFLIDEMHAEFLKQMQALFEKYKAQAGYPDAVLQVV